MPELPEVETMRRGIQAVCGGTILAVRKPRCRLKPISITPALPTLQKRVRGRQIVAVDRLGKRVVLKLDNDSALVFEPRMTGLVLISEPPNQQHLRLRIALANAAVDELLFWDRRGLGTVTHYSQLELQELETNRLGPDALKISRQQLLDRLSSSGREVKVALLDQKLIAGIGNLYASEMLHLAAIDPRAKCNRLSSAHYTSLHRAMRSVLLKAIRYEGSTLADGTYRNALNETGSYQNHHRVYAKAGQSCVVCRKTKIVRIVQAQRSTFFCPHCQRQSNRI
jgi:formamidopyrimidine-DNA glycosylase